MPALLVPSPIMLDQSFPRSSGELSLVAVALGELETLVEQGAAQIVLTPTLCDFLADFDWSRDEANRLVHDIFRLLSQWALQQHGVSLSVDVSDVTGHEPHPVPNECHSQGLVDIWSDEIGRLLKCHDEDCGGFCIGIASCQAFGGGVCGGYPTPYADRAFPLIGPENVASLENAYSYDLPAGTSKRSVSFSKAYKNVGLLGAARIDNPPGGSHFKVRFPGKRPWPLDRNHDPIPEAYLKELEEIVGMPVEVISYVLSTGEIPPLLIRIGRLR
jgi:hypothetical protein